MEIKRFFTVLCLTHCLFYNNAAFSYVINEYEYGQKLDLLENTIVTENALVDVTNINIVNSIFVANSGELFGNINVADGRVLHIQNMGKVNANFRLGESSRIVQVVYTDKDFNSIGLNSGYDLLINNSESLSLSSVINFGATADKIIFYDSVLKFDGLMLLRRNNINETKIEIVGDVIVYANSVDEILNKPILSNVSGEGSVSFYVDNLDDMYVIKSYLSDENVYGKLVRETDYSKILKNKTGDFLDNLRNNTPDDKLFSALDGASDRTELENVMKNSVKLNPMNLMNPIRIFNSFQGLNISSNDSDLDIEPIYMFSDDFYSYGINARLNFSLSDKMNITVSGYGARLEFSDYINEFSSCLYGASFRLNYDDALFMLDGVAGVTVAKFDVGAVFDGNNIENNPSGVSYYFTTNIGHAFNIIENLDFVPFVNIGFDYVSVMSLSDIDFVTGIGSDIKFKLNDFDIKYDYGLRFRILTSGQMSAAFRVNILSPFDRAGGNVEIATIYDEMGVSYNLRLGATIEF